MSRAPVLLAALVTLFGGACHPGRTEVFVVISNGGVGIPQQVDTVRIRGTNPQHPERGDVFATQTVLLCHPSLATNCERFPLTMTLVPGVLSPTDPVRLHVEAMQGGFTVQDDAVEFSFAKETSARLDFTISPQCLQKNCAIENKVCTTNGLCTQIMPLPFTGEPNLDQGAPIFDGGSLLDGAPTDSGAVDGGQADTQLPTGLPCGALSVDGQTASAVTDTTTNLLPNGSFAAEAWIRPTDAPTPVYSAVHRGDTWSLGLANAASGEPMLRFQAKLGDGSPFTADGGRVALKRWSHIAVSYDNTTTPTVTLFVDGTPSTATTLLLPIANSTEAISFAGSNAVATDGYLGYLDEARVSKYARYNAPFTPFGHFQFDVDTFALYHFDEPPGSTPTNEVNATKATISNGAALVGGLCAPYRCNTLTLNGGIATLPVVLPIGSLTMEGWFHHTTWGTSATVFDLMSAYGDTARTLTLWAKGGQVGLTARCANGTSMTSSEFASRPLRPGIWSHVALVYDSNAGSAQVFVDGEPGATQVIPCGNLASNKTVKLGTGNNGSELYAQYTGSVDEVRISNTNRYSMSFNPIALEASPDPQTLGLYHFSQASTVAASDSSSFGNNGTLSGGTIRTDLMCF